MVLPYTREGVTPLFQDLAAVGGVTPPRRSVPLRAASFVVLMVLAFFTVMTTQTQQSAYALALPPPIAALPVSITGAGGAAAAGEATAVTAGATGAAATCVATVVCVAGVLLVGTAIYIGWHWHSSHHNTDYDPPGGTGMQYVVTSGSANVYFSSAPTVDGGNAYTFNYTSTTSPPGMTFMGFKGNGTRIDYTTHNATGNFSRTIPYASVSNSWTGAEVFLIPNQTSSGVTTVAGAAAVAVAEWRYGYTPAPTGTPGTNTVTTTPTSQCSGGGSVAGTPVTYTGNSTTLPTLVLPACPAGQTRTGATFPTTAPGVTSPVQPISNWTAPTIPSGFPECNTVGKICQLNLFRVGHGSPVQQTACDTSGNCAQWQTQTVRQGARVTVKTLVAGTFDGVAKSPGDDILEQPRMWPNGDTADCEWGPYHVTVDGCGTVPTDPVASATAGTADETKADGDGGKCFPTGWAIFNPVEWVYKPVKCALVWAFVPPQSAIDAAQGRLQTAWDGTALDTVSTAIAGIYAPISALGSHSAGSCDGPAFVIPQLPTMPSTVTLHPLSTCPPLVAYILGIYLPIATACIYIGGFFAGTRRILKAFGADGPDGDDT